MKRYPYLKCLWAVLSASVILFGVTALVTQASPDSGNTWTVGGPCGATIQACVNTAANGDTVLIPSGTYVEFIRLTHPVSLIGVSANGVRPTIKAPATAGNIDPVVMIGSTNPLPAIGASTVISNLIITGGWSAADIGSPSGGGLSISGERCAPTIQNVILSSNSGIGVGGLSIVQGASPQLINLEIKNNTANFPSGWSGGGAGISIWGGAPDLVNSVLFSNQDMALGSQIFVRPSPLYGGSLRLRQVTIANPSAQLMGIYAFNATLIMTNTIIARQSVGLSIVNSTLTGDYNLYFGNNYDLINGGAHGHHDVSSDPSFVDPAAGNYHLRPASAAIDHGINAGVAFDFDGEVRPMGSGYDIGFDEATILDADHDGLTDAEEIVLGTDPHNPDTDGDGLPDGWEVQHGLNPLSPGDAGADPDGDGLSNRQEYQRGTDPQDADTDHDGYSDGAEVNAGTNPLDPNSHPVTPAVINGTIVSPQAGQILSATQISINGTASATNGVRVVQVSLDGGTQWVTATGTTAWTWLWSTPLEDGVAHMVTVRVRDSVGQVAVLSSVRITVDRVAPQASLLDPLPNQAIRTRAYTITGKANDGSGVSRVRASTDNGSTYTDVPWSNGLWSFNWNILLEDGVHHALRVIAVDVAGNSTTSSNVPVLVDNVPPTINFNNLPVNGTTTFYTNTFTVIGTSSGASSTTLDLGSGAQSVPVINTVFTRTWSSLMTGTYTLRAVAQDTVGNASRVTTTVVVMPNGPGIRQVFLPLIFRNFDPLRDRYEEDTPYSVAPPIMPDGSLQHRNFYPVNDVDWARLDVPAGTFIISTSGLAANTDTVLRLYASNGVTQLAENDDCTLYTRASCLTWTTTTSTTLYIQIAPYNAQSIGADRWYDLAVVRP